MKLSLAEKVAASCIWKQAVDHLIIPLSFGAPLYSSVLLQLFVTLDVVHPVCMFYSELCMWLNVCVWLWIISLILHLLSSLTQVKQCHRCERNFLDTDDLPGVHVYIWKCNLWPVSQFLLTKLRQSQTKMMLPKTMLKNMLSTGCSHFATVFVFESTVQLSLSSLKIHFKQKRDISRKIKSLLST